VLDYGTEGREKEKDLRYIVQESGDSCAAFCHLCHQICNNKHESLRAIVLCDTSIPCRGAAGLSLLLNEFSRLASCWE
jgi:hypothetical protein